MKALRGYAFVLLVFSSVLTFGFMQQGGVPAVHAPASMFQGDLILSDNNVTVIQGRFDISGSIIVEGNATLVLKNAVVNLVQTSDHQFNMTFRNPANGNPRLIVEDSTLMSSFSLFVHFFGNSSCVADTLYSWPSTYSNLFWLYDTSQVSISNSTVYGVIVYSQSSFDASHSSMRYLQVFGSASVNVSSSSYIEDLTSYSIGSFIVSDSDIYLLHTKEQGHVQLVNSTYHNPPTTYNQSSISVCWYLTVKVTDLYGVPLDFVTVTARYSNFTIAQSKLTDVNGIARLTLTAEVLNANGTFPVEYSSIDASHVSGAGAGLALSVTGNQEITMSLYINANDYIVIKPDGGITPPSANVTTLDRVTYFLTGDNNASVIVERSNIIINGMGYAVQATGLVGFSVIGMRNVTIENATIANSGSAIRIYDSSNCTISGNIITDNYNGVDLYQSFNCTVSNNNITNSGRGMRLGYSSGNIVSGNVMTNNTYGNFGVFGYDFDDFVNYIDTSNLVDSKPVYYLANQSNIVVSPQTYPEGVGYLGLFNCKNVTVQNLALTGNAQSLLIAYTNDSSVVHNAFTKNGEGVDIYFSPGTVLSGNNMTGITDEGNLLTLESSPNCIVSGNNITDSPWGGGLQISGSSNCTVSGNNIAGNYYGVSLSSSSGNTFFHNNFIDNAEQVYSYNSTNTWDNGYPSGGNHWSNYMGVDLYHGSGQNVAGGDGIGDANYTLDANNVDRYPLMGSLQTFSAGTWNNTPYSVDISSNSTIADFSFNPVTKTLTFSVTGTDGSMGFCRVAIPTGLMWVYTVGEWSIMVNGTLLTERYVNQTGGYTYIYFNYPHSTETVVIQSTGAVAEFQPFLLLPLFLIMTLFGTFILKMRNKPKDASEKVISTGFTIQAV